MPASETDALEEQKNILLASLEDLEIEFERGNLSEADYRSLKSDYTARAAAVIHQIDDDDAPVVIPDAPRRSLSGKGMVVLTFILVVGVASVYLVVSSSRERLSTASSSGDIALNSRDTLARARELGARGKLVDAIKLYDEVIASDSKNAEALAYRGWLLHLAGLGDRALVSLNKAVEANPSYPDARFFRAEVLWKDMNQPQKAIQDFDAFLANNPPKEMVAMVKQARSQAIAATKR